MFGASIVRQKREKERKERLARGDPPIIPFIKPFPARFDPNQLPYFKYRQTLAVLSRQRALRERSSCGGWSERRERVEEDNILLYVGLGMSAVGLAVTFVGVGDKGFQSVALQVAGPAIVLLGLCLILVRILLCALPACLESSQCQHQHNDLQSVVLLHSRDEKLRNVRQNYKDTVRLTTASETEHL